jgi:hypothetical protein
MAASLSVEQVLEQICEKGEEEEAPDKEKGIVERFKVGFCSAVKDGEVDTALFVSSCTRIVESFYTIFVVSGCEKPTAKEQECWQCILYMPALY